MVTRMRQLYAQPIEVTRAKNKERFGIETDADLLLGDASHLSPESQQKYKDGKLDYGKMLETDPAAYIYCLSIDTLL
jgi:hypothetical protein